jgi:hypothetical protein
MKKHNFNSKKSPLNVNNNENEIDVNVLLNDPKSLHKMLNKKSDDEKCKVSVPFKKKQEKVEANVKPPLAFFKEQGGEMLKKHKEENESKPKKRHRSVAERLDKNQSKFYKNYDKITYAMQDAGHNFARDVKKNGIGETLKDRGRKTEDFIVDFMKNNEFLQNTEKKLKPYSKILKKLDPFHSPATELRNKKEVEKYWDERKLREKGKEK